MCRYHNVTVRVSCGRLCVRNVSSACPCGFKQPRASNFKGVVRDRARTLQFPGGHAENVQARTVFAVQNMAPGRLTYSNLCQPYGDRSKSCVSPCNPKPYLQRAFPLRSTYEFRMKETSYAVVEFVARVLNPPQPYGRLPVSYFAI